MRRLKGWGFPALVLLGSGVLGAVRDTRYGGDIVWARDYRSGLELARQAHKPLLLSFRDPGCDWCAKLDAETFTDSDVVTLSHRYVCVLVESDVDSDVVSQYGVMKYPMTLLVDPQGRPLFRLSGYLPPDRLAPVLRAALQASDRNAP